jgi:hypothetical protein
MTDDHVCPICGAPAVALDRTGHADGFDCRTHGLFKVASTVFTVQDTRPAGRDQWEQALVKAKSRAKDGELATITTYDF